MVVHEPHGESDRCMEGASWRRGTRSPLEEDEGGWMSEEANPRDDAQRPSPIVDEDVDAKQNEAVVPLVTVASNGRAADVEQAPRKAEISPQADLETRLARARSIVAEVVDRRVKSSTRMNFVSECGEEYGNPL